MNEIWLEVQQVFVWILLLILAVAIRYGIQLLRKSRNKMLQSIGEFAHQEIENTMSGQPGSVKMDAAVEVALSELKKRKVFTSLKRSEIEALIQKAWEQSNPNKNTPQD